MSPCRLTSFFRLFISCSVAEIFSVKDQSRSQKAGFFAPSPWGLQLKRLGSSDQIFQIAVIPEYVSKFGCDPFSDLRDLASKKEERIKKKETTRHAATLWLQRNGRRRVDHNKPFLGQRSRKVGLCQLLGDTL